MLSYHSAFPGIGSLFSLASFVFLVFRYPLRIPSWSLSLCHLSPLLLPPEHISQPICPPLSLTFFSVFYLFSSIRSNIFCPLTPISFPSFEPRGMSGSSYRLETPRPRRAPSPLVFDIASKSLSVLQEPDLLYDLPPNSISPPPLSPRTPGRIASPTSPTFPGRSRGTRNGRPTPPPSSRNRSQTPQGIAQSELEQFAEHCRAW